MKTFQTFLDMLFEDKLKSASDWCHEPLNDEKHPEHDYNKIEKSIENKQKPLTDNQFLAVAHYTSDSREINGTVARLHNARREKDKDEIILHKNILKAIGGHHQVQNLDSALNHPIGRTVHVYSGLHHHPIRLAREELGDKAIDSTGHVMYHMPAYTSTSLSRQTALRFSKMVKRGETHKRKYHVNNIYDPKKEDRHILHLKLNPEDKARSVGSESGLEEHEVLIPRNTRVRIHKTPTVLRQVDGRRVFIWHGHIHSQETPPSTQHEEGDD